MLLSGGDISNIAVQRTVDSHKMNLVRARTMYEIGQEAIEYWSASILI
jgi:hypothetical protein